MKHLLGSLATLSALLGLVMIAAIDAQSTDVPLPVKFGMEASAIDPQKAAGVTADYGSIWVGPWNQAYGGWNGADAELQKMNAAGVTPAIHFYYWGDDISTSCVENGCWSNLHGAWKDRAGWEALGQQLTDHLNTQMGGKPVMIFLESEFNKGGIESHEPFDGYMATMAANIRADYPNVQIVLAFGNWGQNAWGNFDRAAAASDFTGVQSMRGSTRDTYDNYGTMYESVLSASTKLKNTFGKPIVLTDLALSSYPESSYVQYQADTLREVFTHLGDLKSLGVKVIIYRSWYDSPGMPTANWYGEAERHWGLVYAANKTYKPVAHVWINGVKAERSSAAAFTASFSPVSQNEWWVEAKVTASSAPSKVEAKANNGAWQVLSATNSGTWAKSFNVPRGSSVVFKATSASGQTATSAPFTWMSASSPTTTSSAPAFTASFQPVSQNEWWVETKVTASSAPTKVEAQVNNGAWQVLAKTSQGTWAKSFNAPQGSKMVFKATSASGQTATSAPFTWMSASSPTTTSSSSAPAFTATFEPRAVGNDWWVEALVTSSSGITKVEAREDGGAWILLSKTSSGTWATSIHVENGHRVEFRATATTGATATSSVFVWT